MFGSTDHFLQELDELHGQWSYLRLIMGNFNRIQSLNERSSGGAFTVDISLFSTWIGEVQLHDLPMVTERKQSFPKLIVVCCEKWEDVYSCVGVMGLPWQIPSLLVPKASDMGLWARSPPLNPVSLVQTTWS